MKKLLKLLICVVLVFNLMVIPVLAETITPETFAGSESHITSVFIGSDVTDIQDGSFSKLKNLKEIVVSDKNPNYSSFLGCLYNKDFTQLVCIPQNTTTVKVKKTITSYTDHALDGLASSRKAKLDNFLATAPQQSASSTSVVIGKADTQLNTVQPVQEEPVQEVPQQEEPVQEESHGPSVQSNTDFSQYVFTASDGSIRFKYTGHGDSAIIVPEGVELIEGFTNSAFERNTDITYVYLPSTLRCIDCRNIRFQEEYGWDKNTYCVLYECPNLRTVEGGCWADSGWQYRGMGDHIIRPQGIVEWSTSSLIPFDRSRYH